LHLVKVPVFLNRANTIDQAFDQRTVFFRVSDGKILSRNCQGYATRANDLHQTGLKKGKNNPANFNFV